MRLAEFILANIELILVDWEVFARSIAPAAKMNSLALRDHADEILKATAEDMKSAQSDTQRTAKSKGHRHDGASGVALNGASELHAVGRLGSGFDLLEVVSEYRALRASVLELWHESNPGPHERDVSELTRFNESIDQSLAKAVMSYTQKVDQSRDLFLAILSHDLRNPLNSIAMSAQMIPHLHDSQSDSAEMASQIAVNVSVMARMIGDLLDYTRTRLGAGMPVLPAPMNAGKLCRALYDEFRTAHPKRAFQFVDLGDTNGTWDPDRLRQAVSNLMGNAVQHGAIDVPVSLKVDGQGLEVIITVHNGGPPIPPGELPRIFEPLIRGASAQDKKKNRPGSIGLGLYIAREVANSHGGGIGVQSEETEGTTFTVHLPRTSPPHGDSPILDEQHIQTM